MPWPEPVTYVLLVVLGYALTRVVDLWIEAQRRRLKLTSGDDAAEPRLSATARHRLLERQAVYGRFRDCVGRAVDAAVSQGAGTYGMLYQIRDAYADLLRAAPAHITEAADSVIRCVTLLVNLGPSDQRHAMCTRALARFDEECAADQGGLPASAPREFSVMGGSFAGSLATRMGDTGEDPGAVSGRPAAPRGSGSGSAPAPM